MFYSGNDEISFTKVSRNLRKTVMHPHVSCMFTPHAWFGDKSAADVTQLVWKVAICELRCLSAKVLSLWGCAGLDEGCLNHRVHRLSVAVVLRASCWLYIMSTSSPLTFSTKSVRFHGDTKRIVLQNENGPCPLLAILNALILKGKLELPAGSSKVDSSGLQHQLVGHIVDSSTALALSVPGGDQQDRAANLQYQIDDTIKLVMMGRFIEGMDVNLEFGDCIGFEYTREVCIPPSPACTNALRFYS